MCANTSFPDVALPGHHGLETRGRCRWRRRAACRAKAREPQREPRRHGGKDGDFTMILPSNMGIIWLLYGFYMGPIWDYMGLYWGYELLYGAFHSHGYHLWLIYRD